MLEPTVDPSVTTGLSEAIQSILPALEEFTRFKDEDRAADTYARWSALLDGPLPEKGRGADETLRVLREIVIPCGLRTGAPGFAGWVTTMPTVVPTAAALSASIAGPQRWWVQPFNTLEHIALEWLKALLGLPASHQGTFNSGGSAANLIALASGAAVGVRTAWVRSCARRPGVSRQAARICLRSGSSRGQPRRGGPGAGPQVPCPDTDRRTSSPGRRGAARARLREDKKTGCTPIAVIASAGTVNTGAIDPIAEALELCRDEGVWLHVDGAYGGFGVLDPDVAPLFEGLAEADSLAVDPHKWLAVPLGCGATFVRDRGVLGRALTLEPAVYLEGSARQEEAVGSQFDGLGYTFHDFNLEQSARSRGVTVWSALHEMGAEGMRARVVRHNGYAARVGAARCRFAGPGTSGAGDPFHLLLPVRSPGARRGHGAYGYAERVESRDPEATPP